MAAVDASIAGFVVPLIDALRAAGYSVESACADGAKAGMLRTKGYRIHRVSFSRRVVSCWHVVALMQLIRLMCRNRYDIVHVHTPIASVLGRIAAKLAGVPVVVYTAHGFYFHEHTNRLVRKLLVLLERFLCQRCTDMLLTVSCEDRDTAISERIMPPDRVACIRSVGVDLLRFRDRPFPEELRQQLGLPPGAPVVGFVGRLVREKGIEDLVRAMPAVREAIPDVHLLVIGGMLDSERDRTTVRRLRRVINQCCLEEAVVFTGFREDVPDLLRLVDVFALPSYREGMPITILEAMASGKPVVATDIRGCREEVVDGVTGLLVPVNNPSALASAIVKILKDEGLRRRMGEEGRQRVYQEYDQRRVLRQQVLIYGQLAQALERGS